MAKRQKGAYCEVFENSRTIYVWADDPVIEQIKQMSAVNDVRPAMPGSHTVSVDPRYSIHQVAKEIEVLAKPPSKWEQIFKIMVADSE